MNEVYLKYELEKTNASDGGNPQGGGDFILVDLVGSGGVGAEGDRGTEIGGDIVLVDIVGTSDGGAGRSGADGDGGGIDIILFDIVDGLERDTDADEPGPGGVTIYADSNAIADGQTGYEHVTGHEIGHCLGLRHSDDGLADDSFDFTPQPNGLEAPVAPGGVIMLTEASCPPDDAPYDPIADLLTRHENVSEADEGNNLGGGDIILVDIVGSSASDVDLMLT